MTYRVRWARAALRLPTRSEQITNTDEGGVKEMQNELPAAYIQGDSVRASAFVQNSRDVKSRVIDDI